YSEHLAQTARFGAVEGRGAQLPITGARAARVAAVVLAVTTLLSVGPSPAWADGGVNTGSPGSTCRPRVGSTAAPLQPGLNTTRLGPGAPAYYEVGTPTGIFGGQPARGVMMI